ncbi:DeoR/GlpR family DNA-binding transcription regulator [Streptomyces sp. NPDC047002]|uniref:DeoR/GlpR family DNA-binding transcription regulator n=1 Tax=Streptomyces sp. NPDC047002 TaxID=3155475 RepID=UPI0034544028
MNSADRRRRILALLSAEGEVSVEALAGRLDVTASTIRRDLTRLTADGAVTRTYGGAVVPLGAPVESPLHQRARESRAQKDAIGRWAAAQVREGETVMLDAGTTVARAARHLRRRTGLTVITNGLTALAELADADAVDVIGLGGSLRHISHGFVGSVTDMNLQRFSAHRVFLGADGLTADRGICEASPVQTRTKEVMAARGDAVYVLADSTKIGRSPFTAWAPLQRPWTLVTDASATEEQLAPFREAGNVEIVTLPTDEQTSPPRTSRTAPRR